MNKLQKKKQKNIIILKKINYENEFKLFNKKFTK